MINVPTIVVADPTALGIRMPASLSNSKSHTYHNDFKDDWEWYFFSSEEAILVTKILGIIA
ncbi:hypothetical protein GCM10020331_101150 [Ectobacillus funiculus]